MVVSATIDTRTADDWQRNKHDLHVFQTTSGNPAPKGNSKQFQRFGSDRLGGDPGEGVNDAVHHLFNQQPVIALAHNPDHGLGAGGANDQAAMTVEAAFAVLDGGPHLGILQWLAAL